MIDDGFEFYIQRETWLRQRAWIGRAATVLWSLSGLVLLAAAAPAQSDPAASGRPSVGPVEALRATLPDPLAELVGEILIDNPDLATLQAAFEAAEQKIPQARALPDPTASLTAFLQTPETRVGPQQASAMVSQRFPWFGKLRLREQEARLRAAVVREEVEAKGLELVTEARRLAYELAYLRAEELAVQEDRETLSHFEELARARYASGVGLGQVVIKLQAEITRDDSRLLRLAERRTALRASMNALRDRGAGAPLPEFELLESPPTRLSLPLADLVAVAASHRPEVARSRILVEAAGIGIELAKKESRPDLTLGLGYTLVGGRDDAAGRAMPPDGDGDDILGFTVGVNLPIWREKLAAQAHQASALERASEEALRSVLNQIQGTLGELSARLPLTRDQLALFTDLLLIQAQESLDSAETAYATGELSALDLLDAERVLMEVRIASARALADSLILQARLEGALGLPLAALPTGGSR